MRQTSIALTIAGSDSGGGAGIQADLKAFSALGCYGASVITAVTAQNTQAVTAVHGVPSDVISAQIEAVLSDIDVDAIKIGMLFSPDNIKAVAAVLADREIPIVLDPVMIAKSGDHLLQSDAIAAMIAHMLPLADVLTPNLPEAAAILNLAEATNLTEVEAQGRALLALGPKAVLMKGGHASGAVCTDILVQRDASQQDLAPLLLEAQRIRTKNTHGTGCTLSSAIAAELAKGQSVEGAVMAAHTYLQGAIGAADSLKIGSGHGPVHHFHNLWGAQ